MTGPARTLLAGLLGLATLAGGCTDGRGVIPSSGYPGRSTPSLQPSGTTGGPPPTVGPEPSLGATASRSGGAALPVHAAWSRVDVDGPAPSAREDHTWTVDPDNAVAYLFGGRAGRRDFGDLWSFDLATGKWSELDVPGPRPAARFGHDAAWVPGRGLVVTLGQAGDGFFDDIWLLDVGTRAWRELPGGGAPPVARYGSCSGIGPDGRLWISHGFTEEGTRFFDTRAYDFEGQAWSDETPADLQPVQRCLHTCWWTDAGDFALYGGQTTGVAALGDLWLLERPQPGHKGTWRKQEKPDLAARQLPAAARRAAVTVIFGGRDIDRAPLGDAWLLPDHAELAITRLEADGPAAEPRAGASMVYDEARDRMLLFGGIGDAALGDLWQLAFR